MAIVGLKESVGQGTAGCLGSEWIRTTTLAKKMEWIFGLPLVGFADTIFCLDVCQRILPIVSFQECCQGVECMVVVIIVVVVIFAVLVIVVGIIVIVFVIVITAFVSFDFDKLNGDSFAFASTILGW